MVSTCMRSRAMGWSWVHVMREAIRGHQRPSEAISGYQRPSEAVSGHQRQLEAITMRWISRRAIKGATFLW